MLAKVICIKVKINWVTSLLELQVVSHCLGYLYGFLSQIHRALMTLCLLTFLPYSLIIHFLHFACYPCSFSHVGFSMCCLCLEDPTFLCLLLDGLWVSLLGTFLWSDFSKNWWIITHIYPQRMCAYWYCREIRNCILIICWFVCPC